MRYLVCCGACWVEELGSGWLHGERQALQSLHEAAVERGAWGSEGCC